MLHGGVTARAKWGLAHSARLCAPHTAALVGAEAKSTWAMLKFRQQRTDGSLGQRLTQTVQGFTLTPWGHAGPVGGADPELGHPGEEAD